ncbi:MAG TPA: hypothetical protein VFG87_26020 [Amycolatopsis sp.]|jgi:hypothetical protein|nr:hypothetical protein [Amycolatopsis sp.]
MRQEHHRHEPDHEPPLGPAFPELTDPDLDTRTEDVEEPANRDDVRPDLPGNPDVPRNPQVPGNPDVPTFPPPG